MEPGTRFVTHVDQFKEIYKMISTVLENTPNITLVYAIQALSGHFYYKKQGHKEFECRKKKSDEERGKVAQDERHDFSFAATSAMSRSEWLVDSGADSHMTSVRDKFVSMKDRKTPVRITIADGTKIDAVATGTVSLKPMDGTTVSLSDVLYNPKVEGSLISVSKLAEKNVMEAMRCGNIYKLKTVGDEVCNVATTPRKETWAVVHARLGPIPFKRYEQLLIMADGVPEVTDGVTSDAICAGCCMGKMRVDDFPRYPEKLVKSAGVLDLVHTDVIAKSDVLSKVKIFKAALENTTGQRIKRLRLYNDGEHTDRRFKVYLNHCGIKHEKTVPYTPQQNGL
ncbi:Integrase catalytic core protein, partial [Phytophthora palmivora]